MSDTPTLRILDASLNRASEGLRVVEDYVRFVLDDRHLTQVAKSLRHDLAEAGKRLASIERHAARETQQDVGTTVTTETEAARGDTWDVCAASLKRVEQSLRTLEEYGKLVDAGFAVQCEAIRYRTYTLEKALDTTSEAMTELADAKLYVLVDGYGSAVKFTAMVTKLVDAGVDVLQLRDKTLDDRNLIVRARQLVELTRGKCLAIINDRPDIAAIAHADGVHLGQEEMSVKDARAIIGPRALIGVSTHAIEQARQAVLDGANYLGAGPTFPSNTKSFEEFPGLDYLRELAAEISLPTFAIGGIKIENLASVRKAGINRVAVAGAVTGSDDPAGAVRSFQKDLS